MAFSILAAIDEWPSWNPDVTSAKLDGTAQAGTTFRWKSGPGSIVSTLQVVDPPREIGWTGATTMGIKAVHVFRFEPNDGGTLVRSEESWDGLIARMLKRFSRRTVEDAITKMLGHLKVEAEHRAATN